MERIFPNEICRQNPWNIETAKEHTQSAVYCSNIPMSMTWQRSIYRNCKVEGKRKRDAIIIQKNISKREAMLS